MSPMCHYLYYNSDIILSKNWQICYIFFQRECQCVNQASCEWHHQLLWHVRVHSAGTTYFSENYFKAILSFHG